MGGRCTRGTSMHARRVRVGMMGCWVHMGATIHTDGHTWLACVLTVGGKGGERDMSLTGGEPQSGQLGMRKTDGEAMHTEEEDARDTGKFGREKPESAHVHNHKY